MSGEISGYFISFSEKEMKMVHDAMDRMGLRREPESLKKLVLDAMRDDKAAVSITDFIRDHPDALFDAVSKTARMVNAIMEKAKKKGR